MLFSSCTLLTGNGPENGSVSPVFIYEDDGPSAFIVNIIGRIYSIQAKHARRSPGGIYGW
jgi:hypothetical protein